jgi:hypothetical protein
MQGSAVWLQGFAPLRPADSRLERVANLALAPREVARP